MSNVCKNCGKTVQKDDTKQIEYLVKKQFKKLDFALRDFNSLFSGRFLNEIEEANWNSLTGAVSKIQQAIKSINSAKSSIKW